MSAHCFQQSLACVAILGCGFVYIFFRTAAQHVLAVAGILWSPVSYSGFSVFEVGAAPYQFQYPRVASISSALNHSASIASSVQVQCGSSGVSIHGGSSVDAALACGAELRALIFVKRLFLNYLQTMMRCVDLVHSFLPLVSIATFWCIVYAQSNTDGACKTYPKECVQRQYARYWWTSMWGFIVTLVALTIDVWGARKIMEATINNPNVFESFCRAAFHPCYIIWRMLQYTMDGMAMLANLREAFGDDVVAPLYPWRKSHIKIIAGSKVIVNLSLDVNQDVSRENHNLNAFDLKVVDEDLSEALVIGPKVPNSNCFNVRLTPHGQLALLRSNVLPPYDELKFLRGSSSLGMAIASVQAIGYIYGVIVRCIQGLRVSPIEAIACILNMVILMKGVLHNFASLGHRLLLLYLLPEEEAKFIEECKNIQGFKFKTRGRFKLAISIACGVLLAVNSYFIVNFLKFCKRCVVSIILLEVSLIFGGVFGLALHIDCIDTLEWYLMIPIVLLNVIGYADALDLTFRYWKREEFDVQSSNFLSQVLPYIG